jgi:hypothetical protein
VVSPKQKLTKPIKKPKATWVEPEFYAEVEYRDITSEGLLRASSFKGLTRTAGKPGRLPLMFMGSASRTLSISLGPSLRVGGRLHDEEACTEFLISFH